MKPLPLAFGLFCFRPRGNDLATFQPKQAGHRPPWPALLGHGCPWLAMAGHGWPWQLCTGTTDEVRAWTAMADQGRPWPAMWAMACCGQPWPAMASNGFASLRSHSLSDQLSYTNCKLNELLEISSHHYFECRFYNTAYDDNSPGCRFCITALLSRV